MAEKANAGGKAKATEKPVAVQIQEFIQKYSDRYADDEYEYRHVTLPKAFLKLFPKQFFKQDEKGNHDGTLRLLSEKEWRAIGITQSMGWEHYEVHAPEPHVLLFRRPKDYVPPNQPQQQQAQQPEPQNARQYRGGRRK